MKIMKFHCKIVLVIALCVFITSCQVISLGDILSGKAKNQTPKPQFCTVWNDKGCEICEQGYLPDDKGVCKKGNAGASNQNGVYYTDEFGQTANDNYEPCPGKSNCVGNNFQSKNQFDAFPEKYLKNQRVIYDSEPTLAKPANPDFSGTNNQQVNVDEADILKTDGTYIYTISNKFLSIIRAYPSTSIEMLGTIHLGDFYPSAIFIEGNYLAVFGTKDSPSTYRGYYAVSKTIVNVFDISNKRNPNLVKQYWIDGYYFDGRKTQDGFVYLLTTTNFITYYYRAPQFNFNGKTEDIPYKNIYYKPRDYLSPIFANIFSFNLGNPLKNQRGIASIISENFKTIYMSERAIYITYVDYSSNQQSESIIHKVYVKRDRIVPFADGRVKGTINNQFSMDEFDSQILRVATTSFTLVGIERVSSNNVYCLDFFMNQIGFIGGIAPTETIFSARFVDRRLYLVTFRRIDPFFVISFQSHRKPVIEGELKITGFSRYLHPYDQNTIIGLGRQADVNGRQLGLKIALFDVTNVGNPRETDSFQLSETYASSIAEWEHKAFLFSRQKNLLVIPGSLSELQFNGAFVFYIDPARISLKGLVNHFTAGDNSPANVERSLYIEELLYTKSSCLLKVNKIFDLSEVKNVRVAC